MNITLTPDTYTPSVDENGNYIDNVPVIRNGLFCPCGSRKDKTYETTGKFAIHTKSKAHQKWLLNLNQNKANFYVEMLQNKDIIENQKKIITQLENQIHHKNLTIDYLTQQLVSKVNPQLCSMNLLDIDVT
jgi:hypothetical protein